MILHANIWLVAWHSWTAAEFEHIHFLLFTQKHIYHHEGHSKRFINHHVGPAAWCGHVDQGSWQCSSANFLTYSVWRELCQHCGGTFGCRLGPGVQNIFATYKNIRLVTLQISVKLAASFITSFQVESLESTFCCCRVASVSCCLVLWFACCSPLRFQTKYKLVGADADKRDSLKQTPLHRAAHSGAVDCILALLDWKTPHRLKLINLTCMIVGLLKQRQLQGSWWMFTSRPLNKSI